MPAELKFLAGTPESRQFASEVERSFRLRDRINSLSALDREGLRAAFSELIGHTVDESFRLVPPLYVDNGMNIRIGRNVFINHNCTIYAADKVTIEDDVMIGPNVSILASGHPIDPETRRKGVTGAPIVIARNAWIGAGAIVLHGVTVGEDAVVAAGAVVTKDVPAGAVVAGVPATAILR